MRGEREIMAEVFARGPVAAGIDATLLDDYTGGIIVETPSYEINHIVSIVGWGETEPVADPATGKPAEAIKYWIVRNSWGEYWGEMGFFRLVRRQGARHRGRVLVGDAGHVDALQRRVLRGWTNCADKKKKTFEDPSRAASRSESRRPRVRTTGNARLTRSIDAID